MKNFLLIFTYILISISSINAQQKAFMYDYYIDLNKVDNDQITVELTLETPPNTPLFQFPAIVPGTYKVYDFGRFISALKVYDSLDQELAVEQVNTNQWSINEFKRIKKIKYKVDDTWDTKLPIKVFEPAGTNIDKDNVFVINNHGFFGYFKGLETERFEIEIKKPEHLFGGTSLPKKALNDSIDQYKADSYHRLVDNPIIYAEADTTTLHIGASEVFVSLYSPNNKLNAEQVGEKLKEVLEAQKTFLKDHLPTDHYTFLIYLTDKAGISGAMGALEHWNCSFYFLPEESPKFILPVIQEIAAHEFFHIITPLSIHSNEIAKFDYLEPKMSKHLWLYEGVTEYFAGLALVQNNLVSEEVYLESLLDKIVTANTTYDDELAFTELSELCLSKYGNQYGNVYQKGAIIAMGLDLLLLQQTEGSYNLRDLMLDLSDRFGSEKAFQDEQLFDIIADVSKVPQTKVYLSKYVDSSNNFPYSTIFSKVGIEYQKEKITKTSTFGNVGISVNEQDEIFIDDISDMDNFGKKIGYHNGDVLLKMNDNDITLENISDLMSEFVNNPQNHSKLKLLVRRNGKLIKLKSKTQIIKEKEINVFHKMKNPSIDQELLYKQWLRTN